MSITCARSRRCLATASTRSPRERDAIERQSREAVLLQQVTEAELRALRAQINPHFLFNSLNTVADLIVRDPARAETMTLRLASIFRHVLAHSSRPLTTVRDEIDFLRAYLYIEEARFGDRLRVEISVAPEAAGEEVPSLILQPLVENALKHGLGPKPGPGRLSVSVAAEASHLAIARGGRRRGARRTAAIRRASASPMCGSGSRRSIRIGRAS